VTGVQTCALPISCPICCNDTPESQFSLFVSTWKKLIFQHYNNLLQKEISELVIVMRTPDFSSLGVG
jgi:hypothetical protein